MQVFSGFFVRMHGSEAGWNVDVDEEPVTGPQYARWLGNIPHA